MKGDWRRKSSPNYSAIVFLEEIKKSDVCLIFIWARYYQNNFLGQP